MLFCTKHSPGYSHRDLYWIGCVSGFIWEIIAFESSFSPSPSTEHDFMRRERGMPLPVKEDQPSDKMEHNISNIAWTEQKAECKGRELAPATLHCGGEGWLGRVAEYLGCILPEILSVTDWLGDTVGFDWWCKYAFKRCNSRTSLLKACVTIPGLFVHVWLIALGRQKRKQERHKIKSWSSQLPHNQLFSSQGCGILTFWRRQRLVSLQQQCLQTPNFPPYPITLIFACRDSPTLSYLCTHIA